MLSDETNFEVVQVLRNAARAGQSPSKLLRLLVQLTKCGRLPEERSVATCYFEIAFGWSVRESKPLGAWNYFDGSDWDDDMIDSEFEKLLEEWRLSGV